MISLAETAEIKFNKIQNRFFDRMVMSYPHDFRHYVENEYKKINKMGGLCEANKWLRKQRKTILSYKTPLFCGDDNINKIANKCASICKNKIKKEVNGVGLSIDFAKKYGINIIIKKNDSLEEKVIKIIDPEWWYKKLKKVNQKNEEYERIRISMVNGCSQVYASNRAVSESISKRNKNAKTLSEIIAVNELGQEHTLLELSSVTVSNPAIRRMELMTRLSGFDEFYKKQAGQVCEFWTLTCPSKYHAYTYIKNSNIVIKNKKYQNKTPKDGQNYLCRVWARIRAKYKRDGIDIYGFRIAEPHHDGTPHWHFVVFMCENDICSARYIFKKYALSEDKYENGACKSRVIFKRLDKNRSAAGYLAKYISKNIDGEGLDGYGFFDVDENGNRTYREIKDQDNVCDRVLAWASLWGIRQFQQIGGYSVTVWRHLRKLNYNDVVNTGYENHFKSADDGDWCGFMEKMRYKKMKLLKLWSDKVGKYGSPIGYSIIGLKSECGKFEFISKKHCWTIKNSNGYDMELKVRSSLICLAKNIIKCRNEIINFLYNKRKNITDLLCFDSVRLGGFCAPWINVNNCTDKNLRGCYGNSRN